MLKGQDCLWKRIQGLFVHNWCGCRLFVECGVGIFIGILLNGSYAAALPSDVSFEGKPSMLSSEFWCERMPGADRVLLDGKQIEQLNAKIRERSHMGADLAKYPEQISGAELQSYIETAKIPFGKIYRADGSLLELHQYQQAIQACAEERIPAVSNVCYAVTVQRTNLRYLPQEEGWYEVVEEIPHYDMVQALALDPAEPLAVLHISRDGKYAFAATYNYRGWVEMKSLAFMDRSHWLNYVEPKKFLVVTKNMYVLPGASEELLFQMGSRVPLVCQSNDRWMIRLPKADRNGDLQEYTIELAKTGGLHEGYLPYTRGNIVRQAFYFLGDLYGWDGQDNSVDCSSLVGDAYRTVGIFLPGDSNLQEIACPRSVPMCGDKDAERATALMNCAEPGDFLFRHGHVMLYLGQYEGIPMVIQAASSTYVVDDLGQIDKVYLRRVIVSGLSLLRAKGESTLHVLTSIGMLSL